MAKMKGLGKGLDALLGDDFTNEPEVKSSLFLPISQVESCAAQPRKQFDPDALADLADSIRQHGIIQPLTVRKLQSGYYQIIAGERRWRAARMAGLTQVPAVVIEADDLESELGQDASVEERPVGIVGILGDESSPQFVIGPLFEVGVENVVRESGVDPVGEAGFGGLDESEQRTILFRLGHHVDPCDRAVQVAVA